MYIIYIYIYTMKINAVRMHDSIRPETTLRRNFTEVPTHGRNKKGKMLNKSAILRVSQGQGYSVCVLYYPACIYIYIYV